jgi:hypothetical protein
VLEEVLFPGCAERMHVKAHILALLAVAIAFEGADLVEGHAQVR